MVLAAALPPAASPAPLRRLIARAPFSRKLSLVVAAAVLSATVVVSLASAWQEARRHIGARMDYLRATTSVFASATSKSLARGDRSAALGALRGIARSPGIVYARVTTPEGRAFAELGGAIQLQSDMRLDRSGATPFLSALTSRTLTASAPIVHEGRTVGAITVVADNSDLPARITDAFLASLPAALVALAAAILLAGRLKEAVVRPLLDLTQSVRRVARGSAYGSEVLIESEDEIGELCTGFNTMIGEIRAREKRIADLAYHDAETDLPNRHAFEQTLVERLEQSGDFAVAAICLERFQYIRGAVGYGMANDLLAAIGARALEFGPVARLSTEVIGVILEAPNLPELRQRASALLLTLEEPVLLGETAVEVSALIGLSLSDRQANPNALIESANIALDQGKVLRTKLHVFDEASYERTASNVSLMSRLTRALDSGEMYIHLQPKFDLRAGAVVGAEVLARWRHPERGMVSPDTFVQMAEETGVISLLTEWSLRQALAAQKKLSAAGLPARLAVNLSGRLLTDAAFIGLATRLLAQRSDEIYLEITETATIDNQDSALQGIEQLIEAGARISIDDYGAGLSSLSYLKRIPACELKIDKAFIELLHHSGRDALLVKSTIDLAHSLGMQVTAEGVESAEVLTVLRGLGCDVAQGYFTGRPMPLADFMAWVSAEAPALSADSADNRTSTVRLAPGAQ